MNNKNTTNTKEWAALPTTQQIQRRAVRSFLTAIAATALLGVTSVMAAPADVNNMTANNIRMTVPISSTGAYTSTLTITLGPAEVDGVADTATLSATGVPSGAGVVFSSLSVTNTTTNSVNVNVDVTLNYTNVAQGAYAMAIEATGSATYQLPIPVEAGYQWSKTAAAGVLTDPANWVGGVAPGAGDTIIIPDLTFGNNSTPSILITNDTTIGSVRDIHNGNSTFPNINIAAGATLAVTGDGGYRQLRDTLNSNSRAYLTASGAGTLLVSNANANFDLIVYAENTQNFFLFDQLNTLKLDVNRISIDDIRAYPNHLTNGATDAPRRWSPRFYLAKTNLFRATLTDAESWTNANARDYSFVLVRHRINDGSGTRYAMRLGLYNEFFCDSMLWGGYGGSCDSSSANNRIDFNTGLSGTRTLVVRGPDGVSRMANWTLGDAACEEDGQGGNGTKVRAYLGDGIVDALVDNLYLGRDQVDSSGGQGTGYIDYDEGTIDVNNAFLGYQTGPGLGSGNYAQGTLNVNGTALFRANNSIVLGYTASTNTDTGVPTTYGQINITGGTVEANTITVGGPTALSAANNITINSGGTLVVTNTAASSSARIEVLTMNDSTLTLFADGGISTPYVYVTNLVTGGAGNTIKLASITGIGSYPATLKLISYVNPIAPNFTLDLPAGYYGVVLDNTGTSTVDAVITTNPPATRVWNGNLSDIWNTLVANWQGATVFANGDTVIFDDTATSTAVNVAEVVIPGSGGMLVTNSAKSYSFAGSTIGGSAVITKEGTGSLSMNAICQMALNINNGSVNGSGSLGATTVGAGTTFDYSGSIKGLTTAGTSSSSGTINIGLSVTGGTFDNTGIVNGTFNTSGDCSLTNRALSEVNTVGVSTMGVGGTLVQEGEMYLGSGANVNSRFSIAGNLTGSGTIIDDTGDSAGNNGRVEINPNGVFTPGGADTIGIFTIKARFDLNTGSTPDGLLVIDVDLNNPAKNDVIYVDKWSNFRGALKMNNIGAVPFAEGQSFLIYSNRFGFPNTPENAFDLTNKITPAVPGIGLQWDVSNLKLNGLIAVVAGPSTAPELTSATVGGTNLTLNWPLSHIGYQLQVQTNNLATGVSTNWYPIEGTENVVSTNFPIDTANPAVFYRLSNQ